MNNKKREASPERGSVTLSHKKPFSMEQSSAGASPRAQGSLYEKTKQTVGTTVIDMKGKAPTHTKGESESVMFDKRRCTVSFLHMEELSMAAVFCFHHFSESTNGIRIKAVNVFLAHPCLFLAQIPTKTKGVYSSFP